MAYGKRGRSSKSPYPNGYIAASVFCFIFAIFSWTIGWIMSISVDQVSGFYVITVVLGIAGFISLVLGLSKMRDDNAAAAMRMQFLLSRICALCDRRVTPVAGQVRLFWTVPGMQDPQQFFHVACYRETLKRQARRCPNCNVALYNPSSREFDVPVFVGDGGLLFCSQKCSETYNPVAGFASTTPTQVSCASCNVVFDGSLTKCPNCGSPHPHSHWT